MRESKSAAHTMIALVIGSLCVVVLSGSVLVLLHIGLKLVLCFTAYLVGNLLDLLVCTPASQCQIVSTYRMYPHSLLYVVVSTSVQPVNQTVPYCVATVQCSGAQVLTSTCY
jgi:hypothetical protein